MTERSIRRLGICAWIVCVLLSVVGIVLVLPYREVSSLNVPQQWQSSFVGLTFATVGGFLATRRGRHAIPWIFLAIGLTQAVSSFAVYGQALLTEGSHSDWANLLAWVETWSWSPGYFLIPTLLLQLFPTGTVLTRRWIWLARATFVGLGLIVVANALIPPGGEIPRGYHSPVPTPAVMVPVAIAGALVLLVCVVGSLVSIVLRYRRSKGDEREQLKVFLTAAVGTVVMVSGGLNVPSSAPIVLRAIPFLGIPLIPIAAGIAILKYRLYDIDVVINKALVYGALATFITAVYVGIVVGAGAALGSRGSPNLGLSVAATAVVAVAFQAVRERVQRWANRLVYGERANPYEVLTRFSETVASEYGAEDLLPYTADTLRQATGASSACVWLRQANRLVPAASSPAEDSASLAARDLTGDTILTVAGESAAPIYHQGELLGVLTIAKQGDEPITRGDQELLNNLAAQAGQVLRSTRLTTDLKARLEEVARQAGAIRLSRQRIVATQDDERRALERNIHDGAQQHLVALAVKVKLVKALATRAPDKAATLFRELNEQVDDTVSALTELASGIYPAALEEGGVAAALKVQAARSPIQVAIDGEGLGRYPLETEAAVYFCCLEALQNVSKYAHARLAVVTLREQEAEICFSVRDDGIGFDPKRTPMGSGLRNMTDRLAAARGTVEISSVPGKGTTVKGHIPVRQLEPAG